MTADPSGFINLGVLCLGNSGSKLVVRMIMMTRIILSGIQEALEYQSMGMATMALGLNDNDHESNSFFSEERWLLKQRTRTKWS